MGDIFDAGLVTETQVRDLEQGVISESDLYDQLKTYLFGGEEPVSGVILQDTGKRSNSKLCNASNDFVGSTVKPQFNGQMRTNDSPLLEKVRLTKTQCSSLCYNCVHLNC